MIDLLPQIAAGITALFGVWAFFQPNKFANLIALIPKGSRGLSEIRATYGGLIFSIGLFALWADAPLVYQGLGFGWLGIGIARASSFLLDKSYSSLNLKVVIFEIFTASLLLIPYFV